MGEGKGEGRGKSSILEQPLNQLLLSFRLPFPFAGPPSYTPFSKNRLKRRRHYLLNSKSNFFPENWKKINTDPVCFGAKDGSHGTFIITESGVIYTFKLVHLSGSVSCNPEYPSSYWGCEHIYYGEERLLTLITSQNRFVLLLAHYRRTQNSNCRYFSYKIEGVGVNETELRFNNLPSPLSVSVGQEFQLWYGPDFVNCSEDDNSGETCADVYAWYAWIKAYLTQNMQILLLCHKYFMVLVTWIYFNTKFLFCSFVICLLVCLVFERTLTSAWCNELSGIILYLQVLDVDIWIRELESFCIPLTLVKSTLPRIVIRHHKHFSCMGRLRH